MMKIKTNTFFPVFLIILFCIRAYVSMGVDYFILPYAYNAQKIFVFAGIVLVLYSLYRLKYYHFEKKDILCYLMLIVMIFWNNYDLKNGEYYRAFSFITVIIMYLCFPNIKKYEWRQAFLTITVFIGCFYAFFTIMTFLSPSLYSAISNVLQPYNPHYNLMSYYQSGYMAGITSHYTANGIFLQIGAISTAAYVFADNERKTTKRIYVFVFLCILFSLLISGKRAHTIFTIVAFFFVYFFEKRDRKFSRIFYFACSIVLSIVVIIVMSNYVPELLNVVNRFIETKESGSLLSGRDLLQKQLYSIISENLLIGVGWAWFPYNNLISPGDYAHNVYLQLLGELGIIGSIPFLGFFLVSVLRGIKCIVNIRKTKKDVKKEEIILLSSAIGYQLVFLLYCSSGNPLYDYVCYFTYFVWCAIQESIIYSIKDRYGRF